MTQFPDLFTALAAPFENNEVKLRSANSGRQVPYITARTAMNRLDSVLGPENWWDDYVPLENSVLCRLTIRLPDGSVVTKADAGGYAGMADQGDDDKSGFSDAFKRAAAKFGVARYLYRDGVPAFVRERVPGIDAAHGGELAGGAAGSQGTGRRSAPRSSVSNEPPRSGKALFAWAKHQDDEHHAGLLKILNDWGRQQGFAARMIQWNPEQVSQAYAEACRQQKASKPKPSRSNGTELEDALAS